MAIIRVVEIARYIVGCLGEISIITFDDVVEKENTPWPDMISNHP